MRMGKRSEAKTRGNEIIGKDKNEWTRRVEKRKG